VASVFTHAAAALALGTAFRAPGAPWRYWAIGAACAVVPDLDAIGYFLGVPYGSALGHRGFTHSLLFAAILATALFAFVRDTQLQASRVWLFLFLATCSHGILDAFTNGGGGIAFFAPFDNSRYSMPWQPLAVSPMRPSRFFTSRAIPIVVTELAWVWTPAALFALAAIRWRRSDRSTQHPAAD
jgi:inner membrane protein